MIYTYQETLSMIEAVEAQNYEPNEWEEEFLASITDRGLPLSEKQSGCLTKIYEKATGGDIFQRKEYFKR